MLSLVFIIFLEASSFIGYGIVKLIGGIFVENLPKRMKLDIRILLDGFEDKSVPMFHFQRLDQGYTDPL